MGARLEPDIESVPSFLPTLSDGKSASSTGELWNLRVSCHNVGVSKDEAQGSLLILPTTPNRPVAASEERNIYLWYWLLCLLTCTFALS